MSVPTEVNSTPKVGHPPIQMRHVGLSELKLAGDFRWRVDDGGRRSLILMLPMRGNECCYSTWTIGRDGVDRHWSWDGNTARPTIRETLHAEGIWKGRVQDGFLVEA